ncbi:DEHA2C10340p [Debaryomyces hansenii CBS767]|uniref:non-specific serine/threonine protein kinase n=1 Tax=Debaryomyces hansenii (strain ATCC 36239 / CBS 767 / BCRC 21394 / JCM 1990 / NBRC 0083 / IGC 2968) TaxID=284592 RepID=Q6BUI7_DEBHA|nr:DEHA2C10340p [Debaryomyces hansenii CBS767]CAG86203.2 DEHA2C10340p [Debaryomyces hansenii CBS767]|eukprot:XP_458132.2 DEHA2C10340p [Debaryomyces hansenii CBS767]
MTEASRDIISHHPLHLAMCKCIEDELEMYDYHDFYPGWGVMTMNYRILIQELFKVENCEVASFIREIRDQYSDFLTHFKRNYLQQVKRLFRFILSLPMCEYEIENIGRYSSSNNKGSSNKYSKQFPDFKCDDGYLKELEMDEVAHIVREIFSRTDNRRLGKTLIEFAFRKHELIPRIGTLEGQYKLMFHNYLIRPICSMLEDALNIETKVETERPAAWRRVVPVGVHLSTRTDIVISKGNLVYCVIETKRYPLLPKYNGNPLDGIRSLFSDQEKITKQLICEMLYFKTDKGILTDSYTSVFVELDLDSFERNVHNSRDVKTDNESKIIPIRYMIRDCHSAKPTLRESLLSFIYNSVEEDSQMVIKQERVHRLEEHLKLSGKTLMKAVSSDDSDDQSEGSGSRPGTRDTDMSTLNQSEGSGSRPSTRGTNVSTMEDISEDIGEEGEDMDDEISIDIPSNNNNLYVQYGGDFNTQLIKLEPIYFKKSLLESVDANEVVVAKVYDPRNMNRDQHKISTSEQRRYICDEWHNTEKVCYSILSKDTEFNSCYVRQKFGKIIITIEKSYVAKGYFNLFRYIEKVPLPKDRETYEKAKKQLEIIHRNGIVHRDIREDNLLYTKQGLVYIVDFTHAKAKVNIYDNGSEHDDFDKLKSVFPGFALSEMEPS